MSIRLRLALLYGALVTMTVVASSALLYLAAYQITFENIAHALTAEAADLAPKQTSSPLRLALPATTFATQETYHHHSRQSGPAAAGASARHHRAT